MNESVGGGVSLAPERVEIDAPLDNARRRTPAETTGFRIPPEYAFLKRAFESKGVLGVADFYYQAFEGPNRERALRNGDEFINFCSYDYLGMAGEVGHIWREGSTILLLTTKGRSSGEPRTTPLIYAQDGDRYVIVASNGGAPELPGWYLNLEKTPEVELQVRDRGVPARARTAEGEERARLWRKAK